MTITDSSSSSLEAKAAAVCRLLRATIDTYSADRDLGDAGRATDPEVGEISGLGPSGVRDMLQVMSEAAEMFGELCTDLLLSPPTRQVLPDASTCRSLRTRPRLWPSTAGGLVAMSADRGDSAFRDATQQLPTLAAGAAANTAEERARAARVVAAHAQDRFDCAELLAMLGLHSSSLRPGNG